MARAKCPLCRYSYQRGFCELPHESSITVTCLSCISNTGYNGKIKDEVYRPASQHNHLTKYFRDHRKDEFYRD
jgi:hypothetical protein